MMIQFCSSLFSIFFIFYVIYILYEILFAIPLKVDMLREGERENNLF